MKRIITLTITVVLITIMLCSCSQTTSGTITDKQHVGSFTVFMPIRCGNVTTMTPIVEPEQWIIVVKDSNGEEHSIGVSQTEFNNLHVGEEWKGGTK